MFNLLTEKAQMLSRSAEVWAKLRRDEEEEHKRCLQELESRRKAGRDASSALVNALQEAMS